MLKIAKTLLGSALVLSILATFSNQSFAASQTTNLTRSSATNLTQSNTSSGIVEYFEEHAYIPSNTPINKDGALNTSNLSSAPSNEGSVIGRSWGLSSAQGACQQAAPQSLQLQYRFNVQDYPGVLSYPTGLRYNNQNLPMLTTSTPNGDIQTNQVAWVTASDTDPNTYMAVIPDYQYPQNSVVTTSITFDVTSVPLANINQLSNWLYLYRADDHEITLEAPTAILTYDDSACSVFCPTPGITSQILTPGGDCDGDGITNQTEGYDPDGDGNPSTGTPSVNTDGDGIPDYLDIDTDNDGVPDSTEKGNSPDASTNPADTNKDGLPDYRDPNFPKAIGAPRTGKIIGITIGTITIFSAIIFFAHNYLSNHKKRSSPTRI